MTAPLQDLTLDDLVARNQALGAQQDAIRLERKAIADEIRTRVACGPAPAAAAGDGVANAALPTIAVDTAG